mmetsp:Transcript_3745/g.9080  ORF Transcript_3745/g.9080 Transcript_3745/m.9080 type:complete len:93 (+) Transcript_3745:381-659(+)
MGLHVRETATISGTHGALQRSEVMDGGPWFGDADPGLVVEKPAEGVHAVSQQQRHTTHCSTGWKAEIDGNNEHKDKHIKWDRNRRHAGPVMQ